MSVLNSLLSISILALNILDAFKALKPVTSKNSHCNPLSELGQSTSTSGRVVRSASNGTPNKSSEHRQRVGSAERRAGLRSQLLVLFVWICWKKFEVILDQTLGWILPFFETFKTVFLIWILASRATGCSQIFYNLIVPMIEPYETLLDNVIIQTSNVSHLIVFLVSLPVARLMASIRNDDWFGWTRGIRARYSGIGASNLHQTTASSTNRRPGFDSGGAGGAGTSLERVNAKRHEAGNAKVHGGNAQALPRNLSTLQAPNRLRSVSSSTSLNSRVAKPSSLSQEEGKRITSLSNLATAEKLNSILPPPTGFERTTAQARSASSNSTAAERKAANGMKTFAFIPGQTPPRKAALEPPLSIPTSSFLPARASPQPPGAFSYSESQTSASSGEVFRPASRSPFTGSTSTSTSSVTRDLASPEGGSTAIDNRNDESRDQEYRNLSTTAQVANLQLNSSSAQKASNANSKGKNVSSRSSTLRGKNPIKAVPLPAKVPRKEEGYNDGSLSQSSRLSRGQTKNAIQKSTGTRVLRSRSVTPAAADIIENQDDEVDDEGEEEDDEVEGEGADELSSDPAPATDLTPRKRRGPTLSSPAKRAHFADEGSSSRDGTSDSSKSKKQNPKGKGKASTAAPQSKQRVAKTVDSSTQATTSANLSRKDSIRKEDGASRASETRGRATSRGTSRGRGRGRGKSKVRGRA